MNIDEFIGRVFSKDLPLKPPIVVTDRYIGENYNENQVCITKSKLNNETKVIYLREMNLNTIPQWVLEIEDLEGLLLDKNPDINVTPEDISGLKNLKVLGLMQTNISDFTFLKEAYSLESLDISVNYLDVFPKEICMLKELKYLDISSFNSFTSIPKCINNATNLRSLRIHYNEIKSLPEEIGDLDNLEQLILGGNQLERIPNSIYKLKKLRELDLSVNNIREIDFRSLSNIKYLDEIYILKNPLENLEDSLLDQCKGVLSSNCLRKYFSITLSDDKESSMDDAEVEYSIRALIIRSLYYCLVTEWQSAYSLLRDSFTLSKKFGVKNFLILSGVLLGYVEMFASKDRLDSQQLFEKASEWSEKINNFFEESESQITPRELDYRRDCNSIIFLLSSLTSNPRFTISSTPRNDYTVVFKSIFYDKSYLIETEHDQDFIRVFPGNEDDNLYINNDLNHRRYLKGLILVNKWDAIYTDIFIDYSKNSKNYYNNISNFYPKNNDETSISILKLSYNSVESINVYLSIKFRNKNSIIFKLKSRFKNFHEISKKLFSHHENIPENQSDSFSQLVLTYGYTEAKITLSIQNYVKACLEKGEEVTEKGFLNFNNISSKTLHLDNEDEKIFSPLWDKFFGEDILEQLFYDYESDAWTNINKKYTNLHDCLQKNNIKTIWFIPEGEFNGISLSAAYSKRHKKYAAEFYKIIYKPIGVVQKNISNYLSGGYISVLTDKSLPFSHAEKSSIEKELYQLISIRKSERAKIYQKDLERSIIIHIASHTGNINISSNHEYNCNLLFLNSCKTSIGLNYFEENAKDSLALNLIQSGIKTVITANTLIPDDDAYRIAIRFYELTSSNNYFDSFYKVILESINNKLPFFYDKLRSINEEKLASSMEYKMKYDNKGISSWKYYILWDGTYDFR